MDMDMDRHSKVYNSNQETTNLIRCTASVSHAKLD